MIFTLKSSILDKIWFEEEPFRIVIQFKNGRVYEYWEPEEGTVNYTYFRQQFITLRDLFVDMLAAESPGNFFQTRIRGKLPYREITPQEEKQA